MRFNNEEGPIAVENYKLKKTIFNLKKLCEENGIPAEEVKLMLQQNQKKNIKLIEKGICRLFCHNNDLYLLPYCLDSWKKWV